MDHHGNGLLVGIPFCHIIYCTFFSQFPLHSLHSRNFKHYGIFFTKELNVSIFFAPDGQRKVAK